MADKTLSTIARELFQTFGNNPANRELANTLTLQAPVVREFNPLYTIPRGIETLRNADYGALKDLLLNKYQIAQDPKASLQRAGRAAMDVGEGALDVSPLGFTVKPAVGAMKAAAPTVAREAVNLVEKYGVSPTMNVVKPEGNLNFAPRIKEQLKGPEKQTATSFFGQIKNMPGGSEQSLKEVVERIGDPTTVMTKEQFENSLNPSRYDKIDMTEYSGSNLEDLTQHYIDTVTDHVDDADIMYNLGVPPQHQELVGGLMWGDFKYSQLSARDKEAFRRYAGVTEEELANQANPDSFFARSIASAYEEAHYDAAFADARRMAERDIEENGGDLTSIGHTKWEASQRLVPMDQKGYFEIGVMHPEYQGEYRHYSGAPKGTIGHVRGTLTQEPTTIAGGIEVPKNSYVVEEIQSDPQQSSAQKGPLRQVHGVLFKAAVQDAFEKGADRIYLPTSEAIVRPITGDRSEKSLDLYKRVYDKEVKQEGLDELASIPGVEVRPIAGLKPGTDDEVQYFYEITASPEAKDYLLKGDGFKTPNFAAGGLVAPGYAEGGLKKPEDKSLSTIASELWKGFGNNPANRELANTLTLRAPVVRELNPFVTIPRGIETLRNTDYGSLKDFLTGKYQIAQDPKASLQRAGQAFMNVGEGALDAAPVLGAIKPAIAGAKAAAPYIAEAGARKLASLEEKYGLPTSPTMNIIPPQGNLNLTTRLDEQIKGPETQTVFDLLKQVQGKPGVTKEGIKKIAQNYPDSAAKISKQEFKENIPASYYSKEDLAADNEDLFDNYLEEAMVNMDTTDTFSNLGLPDRMHEDFDNVISGHTNFSELDPQTQRIFRRNFGLDDTATDDEAFDTLGQFYMDQRHTDAYEYAMDRAGGSYENGYSYKDFQRLVPESGKENYFEFGVTHPEQMMKEAQGEAKRYRHYSNESMPGGLIGHVRGSHVEKPTVIEGGFEVPANSYVIEEIQSDAQKGIEQTGALHQVHGTLFKAAVQDALEKGADRIYLPTSNPIAAVRGKRSEDYSSIYDKAIIKEGLEPLSRIPGVEIKPLNRRILNSMLEFEDMPAYHEITISPEAREYILKGPGQSIPGYAAGGLVASDYDEEQIDRLSDEIMNFAKGGGVKDPFEDMTMVDKAKILYKGVKNRYGKYSDEADKHGEYPDVLSAKLKSNYLIELGNSRENRTPLDVAINYGGGYDFGANAKVDPQDVRDMAKAYQLWDYMTSIRDKAKQDAISDYYENMEGVEAGIAGRGRGRMSESDIVKASAEYGKKKATSKPVVTEKGYAGGGLIKLIAKMEKARNEAKLTKDIIKEAPSDKAALDALIGRYEKADGPMGTWGYRSDEEANPLIALYGGTPAMYKGRPMMDPYRYSSGIYLENPEFDLLGTTHLKVPEDYKGMLRDVIPNGLVNIELPKELRGFGLGTEAIGTLMSIQPDVKRAFNIYDVQPKAKKFWKSVGAEKKRKTSIQEDWEMSPESFVDALRNKNIKEYAQGGLVYNDEEINRLADQLFGA